MVTERMNGTERTADDEPTPDERLPPRETRTELLRRTARNPEPHRQRNALEIEPGNATLKPLPPTANQQEPIPPNLPLYFFYFFHHLFFERNKKNAVAVGWRRDVGRPTRIDSPKESIHHICLCPERSGRAADEKQGA
jgi:hypothetical protein